MSTQRPHKTLSEEDVATILKRATELQAASGSSNLTMRDLELIAAELDIDASYVQAAARELTAPPPVAHARAPRSSFSVLGAPTKVVVERRVPVAVDASSCEPIFDIARQYQRREGRSRGVGGAQMWRGGGMRVAIMPQGDTTRLVTTRRIGGRAVALYVSVLSTLAFILVSTAVPLGIAYETASIPILASIASFVVVFMGLRYIFGRMWESAREDLEELSDVMVAGAEAVSASLGKDAEVYLPPKADSDDEGKVVEEAEESEVVEQVRQERA